MKQTEIGLIPDDWEVKRLGDVAFLKSGKTIDSSATKEGIYPCYGGNGIRAYIPFYSHDGAFPIIGRQGELCGNVQYADGKFYATEHAVICTPNNNVDSKWLYFQLIKADINKYKTGNAQPGISVDKINREVFIPFPPIAEQQRIAKALSDVDALISTTEKLIQKKKNIKQGTMQNLLTGKKRLPGFAKSTNYKQSELGLIPEDWEVKSLGEIFEFRPNNTFTRDCLNDSKGKYQNVHYGDVLIKYPSILDCSKETIPFINEGINVKFSKYGIVEGDIIIADTAEDETVGKAVEIYNLGNRKIVSGLHTFLCRKMTDNFAPRWLGYFMNQSIFHNQLLPFITGTKVSAISRTAIHNVKVLIPSKEEQTAIANVLSSMDKEIETLNTKLEKYRNLKTAMMQQLLTGKIRLVK